MASSELDNSQQNSQSLSIASLTLGILSIPLPFIGFILGILAVVFGSISLKRNEGRKKAIAGIITGCVGIVLLPLLLVILHLISFSLSSLQSNSADSVRKSDVANIATEITEYESNNKGSMPSKYELSKAKLAQVSDIKQTEYDGYGYDGNPKPTLKIAVYTIGENCSGKAGKHNFFVTILLENDTVYCQGS